MTRGSGERAGRRAGAALALALALAFAASALALGGCPAPTAGRGAGGRPGGGGPGGGRPGGGGAEGPTEVVLRIVPDPTPEADDDLLGRHDRTIADEVRDLKSRGHSKMPAATKSASALKTSTVVEVRNITPSALTVWFSGECSRKVTVPPDAKARIVMCPGDYVTAARIENPAIQPFVGDQALELGMSYTLTFYVKKWPGPLPKKGKSP